MSIPKNNEILISLFSFIGYFLSKDPKGIPKEEQKMFFTFLLVRIHRVLTFAQT